MLSSFFHSVLYQPLFNVFVGLYNLVPGHDVGVVILVITVVIRLIVYPLTSSAIKAQRSLQELQPKLEELKKQYAGNQQELARATMELYKNNKVNPFASCLPMLIQLPILIALYMVLRDGLTSVNLDKNLYSFVFNPGHIDTVTLGLFDLQKPAWVLAILAALAQFWQTKSMSRKQPPKQAGAGSKDEGMMATMNKQMLYMMPILTFVIGLSLPAGLTLYWFFSTLLMGLQQVILNRAAKEKEEVKVIEGQVVDKK